MSATSAHSIGKVASGPDSAALAVRARAVIPSGTSRSTLFVPPAAPMARSGQGAWLTDEHGARILDCNNNYTTLVHGHCFEPVQRAVTEALKNGTSFGLPTRREVVLAEHLRDRTGHDQWRFCNSGTEAVMQAIRCARAVTGRDVIVRFQGSYHGTSDPVTDFDKPGITNAERAAVIVLPHGDRSSLRELFDTSGTKIAAVLIDLMPNRAGLQPVDPEFVNDVRQLTARTGSLMIVDEVITFRLALGGLSPTYGITPDLATFGKAIGGGLPVGALAGRADIMAAFESKNGPQIAWGGTFSANPLTMAAGLAAVEAYDQSAIDQLNNQGDQVCRRIGAAGVQVNGRGSLMRIMENVDISDLWWGLYRRGVLAGTNALLALSTPMTDEDLDFAANAIIDAIQAVRS
jgi:glutamate-1-semialdehyde 2,1-aminomutase